MSSTVPDAASTAPRTTIGAALAGHDNALGFIRLLLAAAVIFHHSFPLTGIVGDPFLSATGGQAALGTVAVAGFFAISGYLIAKSGASSDVLQYFWRRILRIFPAYWTVLLVTAFVVGPALWLSGGRGLATYFVEDGTGPWHYFTANWTLRIGTYGIHDLLATTTPYGRQVGSSVFNGSLWTLYYEWLGYVLIGGLVLFGVLTRARVLVPAITGFLFLAQIVNEIAPGTIGNVAPFLGDQYVVLLLFTFMVGATIAAYSRQVVFDDRVGVFAGVTLLATLRFGGYSTIGTIAGAYFILYLGARLPKALHRVGQRTDYSYGVYIYGFLVQQVLANFGFDRLGYLPFSLLALAGALGCAWLSWHIVEKNAMSLKNWGPGRGLAWWRGVPRRIRARRQRVSPDATASGAASGGGDATPLRVDEPSRVETNAGGRV